MITKEKAKEIAMKYAEEHFFNTLGLAVGEVREKSWGNVYNAQKYESMNVYFVCVLRNYMFESYALIITKEKGEIKDLICVNDEG